MVPTPIVAPVRLGALDVSRLRPLVSAAEDDHDGLAFPTVVDPVAGPDVDPKLEHLAHPLRVAELAQAKPSDPSPDPGPRRPVLQPPLPPGVGLGAGRAGG